MAGAFASGERTAIKRQFCKWKDVGAVVPTRTKSRITSSLKVAEESKCLTTVRLKMHSLTALVNVILSLTFLYIVE
jgi:hypothetical protein